MPLLPHTRAILHLPHGGAVYVYHLDVPTSSMQYPSTTHGFWMVAPHALSTTWPKSSQCYHVHIPPSRMLYTSTTDGYWRFALQAWSMTWPHCSYTTASMAKQVLRPRYYHTVEPYYVSHAIEICTFSMCMLHSRTCSTKNTHPGCCKLAPPSNARRHARPGEVE